MHIILGLLGLISTIAIVLWRIQVAAQAAREVSDAAKGIANLPRKLRFQSRARQAGDKLVTDPMEAAAILMLEVARAGGEVSAEHKTVMRKHMLRHFQLNTQDADELIAQAAWLSAGKAGTSGLQRRMAGVISGQVSNQDLADLDEMLVDVASAEGTPGAAQRDVLSEFRNAVGL